jgi:hypothetical protein
MSEPSAFSENRLETEIIGNGRNEIEDSTLDHP